MVSYVFNSCGYSTDEPNAKYCQLCGEPLVKVPDVSTEAGASVACPNCGFTENLPASKFCSQCGAARATTGGRPGESSKPAPADSPGQTKRKTEPREVTGPILKLHPIAHQIDGNFKIFGAIQLRRDGVRFAAINAERINCPLEDISAVVGVKSNFLEIHMKSGQVLTFKFSSARKWVELINEMLPK